MFERVIAQTIQKITAEMLQERSLIPLLDILQDTRIPTRVKPFFETEVHWWLYNDALARAANKRFDYDHPEIASLLNYMEQVQFRHARFEREEFVAVLDSAVKLIYNYLCRPQTTLKWYIFRGQPVRPLNEVMLRFGAFVDYEYFRTVFTDWVERKRAERPTFDAISATEFERVIRRIDDQILLNCTVEGLLEIMDPLFDFIGEGTDQLIPIDALVIFFDDKNIKKLVDQLENYRERGGVSVGREGFVALLDELLSSTDDEPEVDFSNVYQNDALDEVVREHLQSGGRGSEMDRAEHDFAPHAFSEQWNEPAPVAQADPEPVREPEPAREPEPVREPGPVREPEEAPPAAPPVPREEPPARAEEIPVIEEPTEKPIEQPRTDDVPGSEELPGSISPGPQDESHDQARATVPHPANLPGASELESALAAVGALEGNDAGAADEAMAALVDDEEEIDFDAEIEVEEYEPGEDRDASDSDHDAMIDDERVIDWDDDDDDEDEDHLLPSEPHEEVSPNESNGEMKEESSIFDEDDDEIVDAPMNGNGASFGAGPSIPSYASAAIARGLSALEAATAVDPAPQTAPASQGLEDVRRFIDPALERKVAKKIFAKNRAEYDAALDRINAAPTWRAASQVLDEIFIRFDVDPYSRTAIRFTDSVYGRYLPASR